MNGGINFTMDSFTNFSLGTNATYYCDNGFSLNGSKVERTCIQDNQKDTFGIWTGKAPKCYGNTEISFKWNMNALASMVYMI